MKKWLTIILLVSVAGSAMAGSISHKRHAKGGGTGHDRVVEELQKILGEEGDTKIGDLTFNEIEELLGRVSVPMQEAAHIQKSRAASFAFPGIGQYMNDDPLGGTLFLTSKIAVFAGTLVGTYFLLPQELQFGQIDYLNASKDTIKSAWGSQSFMDLLPSIGVMAGGMLLQTGIRIFAASHAGKLAAQNIADGKITFEPLTLMTGAGGRGMGFGFGFRL